MKTISLAAVVLGGAFLVGCGSDATPEPANANDASSGMQGNDSGKSGGDGIVVDDELAKLCDLPTAYFDFNASSVSPGARAALDALAACFTTGKAKDRSMLLVGHADPRGETEYNFGLGQQRAGAVAKYVVSKGVDQSRVQASSRGEIEAVGTDESGWSRDRKVEISLAK